MEFTLAPSIDIAALRQAFDRDRQTQISPFLSQQSVEALAAYVAARDEWRLVFNARNRVYEIDRAGQGALSAEQRASLDRGIAADATDGFQYCYESIRVPDAPADRSKRDDPLFRFATFLSSSMVLGLMKEISGHHDLTFADAQATRFDIGHFLTAHDDEVHGKNRRLAYTFGLSPRWRPEWGGLLLFHDNMSERVCGFVPRINTLSLFEVPQLHSVSAVAASAGGPRYSITGWLRAEPI